MNIKSSRLAILSVAVMATALALRPGVARALVIQDYFSSNIQNSPNAAAIEASISAATNSIAASFTNDVHVNIGFDISSTAAYLGSTSSAGGVTLIQAYEDALARDSAAHLSNTTLATAVANLSLGNGTNSGYAQLYEKTADLQALGYGFSSYLDASNYDLGGASIATGGLNAAITLGEASALIWSGDVPAYSGTRLYSASDITQHEVIEVLGAGGGGSMLGGGDLGGLDLYRYAAPNRADISYTTTGANYSNVETYFSVDGGVTQIAAFNNLRPGDAGDWGPNSTPCPDGSTIGGPSNLIQRAYSCSNSPVIGFSLASPEAAALEAIGWNPAVSAAPEPSTWATMAIGVGLLGSTLRRRRAQGRGAITREP